jgi:ferredoxin
MRVIVDQAVCEGYGQCCFSAPSVFELDSNGRSVVLVDRPDEALRPDVEQAAEDCPTHAITVAD